MLIKIHANLLKIQFPQNIEHTKYDMLIVTSDVHNIFALVKQVMRIQNIVKGQIESLAYDRVKRASL